METSDELDSNPFNFRPLKRIKTKTQTQTQRRSLTPKAKRQKTNKPSQNPKDKYVQKTLQFGPVTDNPSRLPRPEVEVCPVCQLPLDLLKGTIRPNVHIADCQDRSVDLESCPDRGDCASRHPAHYAMYDHSDLARQRKLRTLLPSSQSVPQLTSTRLSLVGCDPGPGNLEISPIRARRRERQQLRADVSSSTNNQPQSQLHGEDCVETGVGDLHQPEILQEMEENIEPGQAQSQVEDALQAKVTGEDSEELDMSLSIKPSVHLTKLELKIPLKKTNSGKEKPVEISASYNNLGTPRKQQQITKYFVKSKPSPKTQKEKWDDFYKLARTSKPKTSQAGQKQQQVKERKTSRVAPFYKTIQNTNMSVDAFCYGDLPHVKYYLLSHFHSDHYQGLTKHWTHPIVCSSITKRLLVFKLKVKESLISTLDIGETKKFGESLVTALDANHCPGSVMFLIQLTSGHISLHTGDFRATPEMESLPEFWQSSFKVDTLYLDTTYCRPEYDFPSQSDVIEKTVDLVRNFLSVRPNTVIMVGAYDVGKERIFKAIVEALDSKIWGDEKRADTWRCLEDEELLGRMVEDRARAQVQVISNNLVSWARLGQQFDLVRRPAGWSHVLGVKPTGWSHSRGERADISLLNVGIVTRGQVSLLEVPYSEHSSYGELERFVKFLRLGSENNVVDTVSRNVQQREKVREACRKWIREAKFKD